MKDKRLIHMEEGKLKNSLKLTSKSDSTFILYSRLTKRFAGAAWGGIKGISLIPFYFQRKGTLVSEIAGNLFCFL